MKNRIYLQVAVAVGGCVPIAAGGAGVFLGPEFLNTAANINPDSHFRYLSGLLLGIGLCFWSTIPQIQTEGTKFRLLAFIVFVGGCGRLFSIVAAGAPSSAMLAALAMELGVTPLLCFWQWHVSDKAILR
jgi:hypothetical protein